MDYQATDYDISMLKRIYALPYDLNEWRALLDDFCHLCHVQAAHIVVARGDSATVRFIVSGGKALAPELAKLYMEKFFKDDKTFHWAARNEKMTFHASNLIPDLQRENQLYIYDNWAKYCGVEEAAATCLFTEGPWACTMLVNRGHEQGPGFSNQDVSHLNFFSEAFTLAVMNCLNLFQSHEVLREKAVLNCFRVPCALFDLFGRVLTLNNAFDNFLIENTTIRLEEGVLSIARSDEDRVLKMYVMKCVSEELGQNFDLKGNIMESSFLDPFKIGIVPVSGYDDDSCESLAGGLIYIVDPKFLESVDLRQIKLLFSLTDREVNVCELLLKGKSSTLIAEELSVSVYTVREYLTSLFRKTNTQGQLGLINLLASLPARH